MQRLILYRPLISNNITQGWGANLACIQRDGRIVSTRNGNCPANARPYYQSIGMDGHNGLDFSAMRGEHIFHAATFGGWMYTETDNAGGIGVNVVSNDPVCLMDGQEVYVKLRCWHLKAPVGHDGKQVTFGQTIGLANNTGASSSDHLHFGVKICDKKGNALEKNNGYYGAFDPTPYIDVTVDAKTAAEMLRIPPPKLTKQERKDISSKLSLIQRGLIQLQELIRKL